MDISTRLPRLRFVTFVIAAVIGTGLLPAPRAQAAPDFSVLRRSAPYVPLFSETNNCTENKTVNNLAGAELDSRLSDLARWFVHFHGEASAQFLLGDACRGASASTLASKLSAKGAWVSNYRNGSYVSQASSSQAMNFGEAADLETKAPRSIATFWAANAKPNVTGDDSSGAARLSQALDATATTIRVTSAATQRPAGAPMTWPFVNSRGTGLNAGAHSSNTHDVVSWVRLDDEMAQIVADPVESGGIVTLTVRRGIWGTGAAAHVAGTRALSPLYIGSTNAAASDSNLAGGPNRDDTGYPLRYGLKIWQPGGYTWIADRIKATFGTGLQGYNAVWLDVSSCNQYNNADHLGQPVFGWDDPLATKMTQARWGTHQKAKLAGLRGALPGITFAANNMSTATTCGDDLLGNAYDGGVLEHWMKEGVGGSPVWSTAMAQNFRIQAGDWPALYWVRWNYDFSGDPAQYRRFSYGSLLLAYRPTATRFQYGGPWGMNRPEDLYFWDWGQPLATPAGTADVKVAGTELYRRDFANGVVVVNPSTGPLTYNLGSQYYDVVHKDASGNPTPVTSITVPAKDAAFLLKPAAPADTQAPTASVASPAPGQDRAPGAVTISGSAADNIGVAGVDVGLQNTTTGQWWHADGTWGAYQTQAAALGSPSSPTTSWSFTWTPPADGSYAISVAARDAAGNRGGPAAVSFTVTTPPPPSDTQSPDTLVTRQSGWFSAKPLRFAGGAVDNTGVTGVRVGIQNTATGLWWHADGTWGAFQSYEAALSSAGAASTSWNFAWTPPAAGSYGVNAVAYDAAGNRDPSSAWAPFKVSGGKARYL